ncbi:2Fe-2S iron-sulfur cluster-binding protein [Rhizobium rhizogenes]|uniref:2Fe-2S iron-sulfur cluster-binding protein n=1 Tax=Rhizobium rhizogenes TaxID=359 RepID=UPI0012D33C35|nr:2Fe-2S iron-sulfur cluster-binding protein [Rhizobium rhizogenes]
MQQPTPSVNVAVEPPVRHIIPPILLRIRLFSGVVLLLFVAMHLINLGLGLHSIAAMDSARRFLMAPWMSLPGTMILAAAVVLHGGLGLSAIASRRSLTLSRTDWVQVILGLITTPLLLNHVALTTIWSFIDDRYEPDYGLVLSAYWKFVPVFALQQVLVVVIVWIHGAIGLYSWLVLKPVWTRLGALVTPLMFAVPILALLGFVKGGKEALTRLATDPDWQARIDAMMGRAVIFRAELDAIQFWIFLVYGILALAALGVFAYRTLHLRAQRFTVRYDGDQVASGRKGLSILEVSLLNNIPHAHICSGRGRCGTCVVSVTAGPEALTPIEEQEAQTLARIQAGEGERLACQACLTGATIDVVRLRPAYADASAARDPAAWVDAPAAPLQAAP